MDKTDDRILTEEEYKFLVAIETFYGQEINSLICEPAVSDDQAYNRILVECEDPTDEEFNCIIIKTSKFNYFRDHNYYFTRKDLMQGWE